MLSFSLAFTSPEHLSSAEPSRRTQIFLIRHRSERGHLLVTKEERSITPPPPHPLFLFLFPFVLYITRMAAVLKVSRACPNSLCKGYDNFQSLHKNAVEIMDFLCMPLCVGTNSTGCSLTDKHNVSGSSVAST